MFHMKQKGEKMAKKSKVELIYDRHYHDMLDLNQKFIQAIARPQSVVPSQFAQLGQKPAPRLTKKQLSALREGRKKLALIRAQKG